jgi:hypothetical protein
MLHGAACHGCLVIAETSCEARNLFLDCALLVDTVGTHGAEYFLDGSSAGPVAPLHENQVCTR